MRDRVARYRDGMADRNATEYGEVPLLPRPEPLRWRAGQVRPLESDPDRRPPRQANNNTSR